MNVARWDRYPDRASARRAAARELHPDRGGDPVAFAEALAEIDQHFRPSPPVIGVSRRRRALFVPLHLLRRLSTRRRYIDL